AQRAVNRLAGTYPFHRARRDYRGSPWSVREAEQRLRVVVKDLVGDGFGQAEPLDIGEGLFIRLVILQDRVVAAGHQMVGAKGFEGAEKRWLRAVADRVVVEFFRGDARRLGEVRVTARILPLLVEPVEQHRYRPAEMRHDELDIGIAVRDLLGDHVQNEGRVLERGADRRAVVVIDNEVRADPRSGRVHKQYRAAPVHLGVDRLELGFGDRA